MSLRWIVRGLVPATLAGLIGAGSALAAPCALFTPGCFNIENSNGNTGWHIEYDPVKVIDPSFVGTPGNERGKDGDLDLDHVIFTNLDPIDIRFIQDRDAPDNEVNFGLRFTLRFDIRNESAAVWRGFTLTLSDDLADFDSQERDHPGFAHFHLLGADNPQAFPPFTRLNSGNPNFEPGNPARVERGDVYRLGNGLFARDLSQLWTGMGIHEWERPGEQRNFTLRLAPIPVSEPGTGWLLALAALAGLGSRGRGCSAGRVSGVQRR